MVCLSVCKGIEEEIYKTRILERSVFAEIHVLAKKKTVIAFSSRCHLDPMLLI